MRKRVLKMLAIGMVTLIFMMFACGCGAKNQAYKQDGMSETGSMSENTAGSPTVGEDVFADVDLESAETTNRGEDRKIIENIELSVETKEFDALLKQIDEQMVTLGGYVENSDIYGREMDSSDHRSANLVLRIPAEKSKVFSDYMSENSVVVSRSVNTQDVTLKYVDMESRVAALRAEKEALENLLKNAEKVDDIISIRNQLTEVIYEIESYESQLRTYDNLVSYATVTIRIEEVERTTVVEEQNAWQKIGTNLKNNFVDVWNGVVAVFVFLISAIPYLLPFAVIAAVVLLIIFSSKKRKRKREKSGEN